MDLNGTIVLDIWELVVEHIPASKKDDVANKLVMMFADAGLSEGDFDSIRGEDSHLDAAIDHYLDGGGDEEEIDYESNDYDEDF